MQAQQQIYKRTLYLKGVTERTESPKTGLKGINGKIYTFHLKTLYKPTQTTTRGLFWDICEIEADKSTDQDGTAKEKLREKMEEIAKEHNIDYHTTPTERTETPHSRFNALDYKKPVYRSKTPYKPTQRRTEKAPGENKRALLEAYWEEQATERAKEAYREYQDNIKRSGTLRAEITKGIVAGEDPQETLIKCIECISLMTGDKAYFTALNKYINEDTKTDKALSL
jgi:hypothetical protein